MSIPSDRCRPSWPKVRITLPLSGQENDRGEEDAVDEEDDVEDEEDDEKDEEDEEESAEDKEPIGKGQVAGTDSAFWAPDIQIFCPA